MTAVKPRSLRVGRPFALSPEQVEQAHTMKAAGMTYRAIAKELDSSPATVHRALRPAIEETPAPAPAPVHDSSWPPPPDDSTVWREVKLLDSAFDRTTVRVRPVRLWGQTVEVSAEGLVFCDGCKQMCTVEALGTPGNRHRVGIIWPGGQRRTYGAGES